MIVSLVDDPFSDCSEFIIEKILWGGRSKGLEKGVGFVSDLTSSFVATAKLCVFASLEESLKEKCDWTSEHMLAAPKRPAYVGSHSCC
jgi:hypothetical protein